MTGVFFYLLFSVFLLSPFIYFLNISFVFVCIEIFTMINNSD
ncbi:hypothetical protein XCR1_4300001 [Xenorhabdus cabanillasii JM26]|uniref:Uncharacterized protein n=1 Tax=Xenorhabdus cabanillasii JM26 TaxID=1427517 RepID=W1J7B9_9GAMM|nr:hypothetical protein XCR1_4300001 [Xenorhabdus cabanillasii JM26]